MEHVYRIGCDYSKYGHTIYDSRKWSLPGVMCDSCQTTWSSSGHEYPSIDLSRFHWETEYRDARCVNLTEWLRLRDQLREALQPNILTLPGLRMGPSTGIAMGAFRDFAWQGSWTCYVERGVYRAIIDNGVRMPDSVDTELKFRKRQNTPDLLELEVAPRVPLLDKCFDQIGKKCDVCGYQYRKWNKQIAIHRSDIPQEIDIFRAINHPTIILASQRFVDTIRKYGFASITCQEIMVE